MSKLSEYSKFDHLIIDSETNNNNDDDDDTNNNNVTSRENNNNPKSTTNHPTIITLEQQQQQQQQQQESSSSPPAGSASPVPTTTTNPIPTGPRLRRKLPNERGDATERLSLSSSSSRSIFTFEYNGQTIYDWEQGLTEIIMYIPCPPPPPPKERYKASDFSITIQPTMLQLSLRGSNLYYINELFYDKIDIDESTWTIEDIPTSSKSSSSLQQQQQQQMIVLYLQKVAKGLVWKAVLKGNPNAIKDISLSSSLSENRATNNTNSILEIDPISYQIVQQEILKERWQEENPGMDFTSATFNGSAPDPRTFMGGVRY